MSNSTIVSDFLGKSNNMKHSISDAAAAKA
jgi:hypothetical protein